MTRCHYRFVFPAMFIALALTGCGPGTDQPTPGGAAGTGGTKGSGTAGSGGSTSSGGTAGSGEVTVAAGTWTAVKTPARHQGVYYGDETYSGMKHVSIALNPLNGRLYFEGGDYTGANGFEQSYQQETWSLDLAARLSAPANRNAGWRLEYPYCGPSGQIQPKHPDTVGWVWDTKRRVFWVVPGVCVSSPALCPGETYTPHSDPGFIFDHLMTFDPVTKQWTDRSGNIHGPYGNNGKAVYDPATDTIIRFGYKNDAIAQVYNILTDAWVDYPLGIDALGHDIRVSNSFPAVDLEDRVIYLFDSTRGRLQRYHMDTHTMDDLGPALTGRLTYYDWDSINHVLYWFEDGRNKAKNTFSIYHPDTDTWQKDISLTTNIPGISATGRAMYYDSRDGVLILAGGLEPAPPPYFYLFRYNKKGGS